MFVRHELIDAMPLLHCGSESGPTPLSNLILDYLPIFPVSLSLCLLYLSGHVPKADKNRHEMGRPVTVLNPLDSQT